MKIFNRLTIRIFTIFLLTIVFFIVLVQALPKLDSRNLSYVSHKDTESGILLAKNIEASLANIPKDGFRWWMRFIVVMDSFSKPGQFLFIVTPTDQIITSESSFSDLVRNFSERSNNIREPSKKIYDEQEIIGPFGVKYSNEEYRLYILQPITNSQSQFISMIFDRPFLLLFLTMLFSSPLLFWLSSSLAKPARKLKKAAEQVAIGNLQEWPELESGTLEFKATGISFNHMLRELKHMQKQQKRLLSDISHELRTPLTRLQLASALMRRKQGETAELARIELETQQLDQMIGSLLQLSRDQYENNEIKEIVSAPDLWQTVIDDAHFEAEQLHKKLIVHNAIPNVMLLGRISTLRSAIENIIRNAFRYSFNLIEVHFEEQENHIQITVEDNGLGVADSDLEKIFRPFYRTSEARDRATGGTGLGLAIVHNAITQDNGSVKAGRSHLGGLKITIQLPIHHNF